MREVTKVIMLNIVYILYSYKILLPNGKILRVQNFFNQKFPYRNFFTKVLLNSV